MAKYSYETYEDLRKSNQQQPRQPKERKVGYFRLNDGEEALVRFDYSLPREFDIVTIHTVKVGDKYRKVSCLRTDGREPLDNCPLCAKGEKVSSRFFAKLIHYTKDETGKVIATPEVANFPKKFADKLVGFINEYGDLKDILVKVKRRGAGMDTEYDPVFANPAIYKEELGYTKDFSAFDNFDLAHHSYVEKSKEDIEEYLKTGDFPYHKQEATSTKEEKIELDLPDDDTPEKVFGYVAPTQKVAPQPAPQPNRTYTETKPNTPTTSDTITARPRRTYDFNN